MRKQFTKKIWRAIPITIDARNAIDFLRIHGRFDSRSDVILRAIEDSSEMQEIMKKNKYKKI